MEFFGFAPATTCNMEPNYPLFEEAILKNYPEVISSPPVVIEPPIVTSPVTLLDTLLQFPVFTYFQNVPNSTVWETDLGVMVKKVCQSLVIISQKPLTRHVFASIVVAVIAYGVWKVNEAWSEELDLGSISNVNLDLEVQKHHLFKITEDKAVKSSPEPFYFKKPITGVSPFRSVSSVGTTPDTIVSNVQEVKVITSQDKTNPAPEVVCSRADSFMSSTEKFQRQLIEALSRLDEVRLRLKELENEKELLTAEIELRKKVIQRLQEENTLERDKRQQAELKMEMMEIENSQLRQLRKELMLKTSQVERLDKYLREKEEQQERLFEENVVLPRSVAQVRAKEFGELQSRIQKLESELSAAGRNANMRNPLPPDEGPRLELRNNLTPSPRLRRKNLAVVSNLNLVTKSSSCSKSFKTAVSRICLVGKQNNASANAQMGESSSSVGQLSDDAPRNAYSPENIDTFRSGTPHFEKSQNVKGVIAHIKALITGSRESSSDSENGQEQRVWSPLNSDGYPLSDGQSSVFMSASSGSVSSDNDTAVNTRETPKNTPKKKAPAKRLSKHERNRLREKDVNVSKCVQSSHHMLGNTPTIDLSEIMYIDDSSYRNQQSSRTSEACSSCSCTRMSSKCPSSAESKIGNEANHSGSSEDRGTESEDSWIVIMPTVG